MKGVKVIFANEEYNYGTSVSEQSTEQTLRNYFVGSWLDMGVFPEKKPEQCIDIKMVE